MKMFGFGDFVVDFMQVKLFMLMVKDFIKLEFKFNVVSINVIMLEFVVIEL